MASQFQNRLIGTIILVAIGVIFLPDFFDGKKEHYKEEFASIPLQPKMGGQSEAKTIPEPENADVREYHDSWPAPPSGRRIQTYWDHLRHRRR